MPALRGARVPRRPERHACGDCGPLRQCEPVSRCRRQAFIEAPVEVVWDLIADVERHPEWWPRVIEVECDGPRGGLHLPPAHPDAVRQGRDESADRADRDELRAPARSAASTPARSSASSSPRPRAAPSSTARWGWSRRGPRTGCSTPPSGSATSPPGSSKTLDGLARRGARRATDRASAFESGRVQLCSAESESGTPSELIDAKIEELDDARVTRSLPRIAAPQQAAPDVVEEINGASRRTLFRSRFGRRDGITPHRRDLQEQGEAAPSSGGVLEDPPRLFNSSLGEDEARHRPSQGRRP